MGLAPAVVLDASSSRPAAVLAAVRPGVLRLHNRLPKGSRCRHRAPRSVARASTRRSSVACRATIPVPGYDRPSHGDLNWDTTFERDYVKGKAIGQGSFGTVYMGIDLHTGQPVAVKEMPKQRGKLTKERTLQKLVKEVKIMKTLQECPNVVRLLHTYETERTVLVVMEQCTGGDLQKLSDDVGALSERHVALIAYEVLRVIDCAHRHGIVHGDIKPANFVIADEKRNPLTSNDINLLFGERPWLRAIDFGCSQYFGPSRFNKRTGTPVYMAPEIFDRDYSWESDMWSLGMMVYQLYARRFPYWSTYEACRSAKLEEVAQLVQEAPIPYNYGPWHSMSLDGLDFIKRCLDKDYSTRMTPDEAMHHPWFDNWLPVEEEQEAVIGINSHVTYEEECVVAGVVADATAAAKRPHSVSAAGHSPQRPHAHAARPQHAPAQRQQQHAVLGAPQHAAALQPLQDSSTLAGTSSPQPPSSVHHADASMDELLRLSSHQRPGEAAAAAMLSNVVASAAALVGGQVLHAQQQQQQRPRQ